jgi:two-component system sensor histidine kinase AlgZ
MSRPTPSATDAGATAGVDSRLTGSTRHPSLPASRFGDETDRRQRRLDRIGAAYDLCRPALVLRVTLATQLMVALAGLGAAANAREALQLMPTMAFAALSATLLWLPSVCALRPWLPRIGAWPRGLVAAALGALAALAAWSLVAALGLASGDGWHLGVAAIEGGALASGIWLWLDLRDHAARPADADARLADLQSRIRPHFLFNALNTVLALMRSEPERAETMLEDLSLLFRVALAEVGPSVPLDEEVDLARRYLEIERMRFGQRLRVTWDIDPRSAAARVPPLVLQPLVENAVRHGIEPSLSGGEIVVRSTARHGVVMIEVSNTLAEHPGESGAGMALANVRERLRLLHDVVGALDIWTDADRFHARITVPL